MMIAKRFNHILFDYTFENLPTTYGEDGSRYYCTEDGNKYPSVTTVTGWEKQAFFAEWRKNNPVESRRVLNRGNKLHSAIEDYLNNEENPKRLLAPNEQILFDQMQDELDKIDNIYAQEVPLWSSLLGLAGRVDCVAEYNGELSIIDFKGSTREKRKSDIENYFMQATAYSLMFQERTGVKVDNIVILISCEDGTVQSFVDNPINYTKSLYECIQRYRKRFN